MSDFLDQMLLYLNNPTQLLQLVAPPSDTSHSQLLGLLNAVYDMGFATVHDVRNVRVLSQESERLVLPPLRTTGTLTQTTPSYVRTDVTYEGLDRAEPLWVDVAAEIAFTLVLEIDAGRVAAISLTDVSDFNSIDEFKAHFHFLNVDQFMAQQGITTVEELKDRFQYLVGQIQLQAPAPFDPNAASNQFSYSLSLAILIRDSIDVLASLRDAKLARSVLQRSVAYKPQMNGADVQTPFAPIVIFPQAALHGLPFTADALHTFFASEHVLALFATPS